MRNPKTPPMNWSVYRDGIRHSAFVYAEDAAAMVGICGHGACVKYLGGIVVWEEGHEIISASESYDEAAGRMRSRAKV